MRTIRALVSLSMLALGTWSCAGYDDIRHEVSPAVETGDFQETLRQHLEAVRTRNLNELAPTLANDIEVIFPNGEVVKGKEAVLQFHQEWFSDDKWIWKPEIIRVESGSQVATALVLYNYQDTPQTDPRSSWLLLSFRATTDGWVLYHDQNTRVSVD